MNQLSDKERAVIEEKATEAPFTGEYCNFKSDGTYYCRRCGAALYRSSDKFDSGCGWPAFDDEIEGAIKRNVDADGRRTEITCAKCGAHLGHVFNGEGYTLKNVRHCVNSASIDFEKEKSGGVKSDKKPTETAIFAGGCFWGVEYMLEQLDGVLSVTAGYTGGELRKPSYEQVKTGTTGHVEAVRVIFDPTKVSYEQVTKRFFEIHDPTQRDGQGPDKGSQYLSKIFYVTPEQKAVAEKLIEQLRAKGLDVATELRPAMRFSRAEEYHQDYYERKGTVPYCHAYRKLFD